jgi:hypothetical protein
VLKMGEAGTPYRCGEDVFSGCFALLAVLPMLVLWVLQSGCQRLGGCAWAGLVPCEGGQAQVRVAGGRGTLRSIAGAHRLTSWTTVSWCGGGGAGWGSGLSQQ